ncbi:hypothetical protein [Mesorhizobium hawassense]|nr:hypothetical protein [Mesorhizobium hawassense]
MSRQHHGATIWLPSARCAGEYAQSSVDAAGGVKARRILFSRGRPSGDLLAALDRFERAIVECDAPPAIETHRLNCLAVPHRLTAGGQPRA